LGPGGRLAAANSAKTLLDVASPTDTEHRDLAQPVERAIQRDQLAITCPGVLPGPTYVAASIPFVAAAQGSVEMKIVAASRDERQCC
jgi:hypothetical protein